MTNYPLSVYPDHKSIIRLSLFSRAFLPHHRRHRTDGSTRWQQTRELGKASRDLLSKLGEKSSLWGSFSITHRVSRRSNSVWTERNTGKTSGDGIVPRNLFYAALAKHTNIYNLLDLIIQDLVSRIQQEMPPVFPNLVQRGSAVPVLRGLENAPEIKVAKIRCDTLGGYPHGGIGGVGLLIFTKAFHPSQVYCCEPHRNSRPSYNDGGAGCRLQWREQIQRPANVISIGKHLLGRLEVSRAQERTQTTKKSPLFFGVENAIRPQFARLLSAVAFYYHHLLVNFIDVPRSEKAGEPRHSLNKVSRRTKFCSSLDFLRKNIIFCINPAIFPLKLIQIGKILPKTKRKSYKNIQVQPKIKKDNFLKSNISNVKFARQTCIFRIFDYDIRYQHKILVRIE